MTAFILPLNDPHADLETVGGKGMSLAKLAAAGLPVPDGFHITTQAYRQFVADNDLQAAIGAALDGLDASRPAVLESASAAIAQLFAGARMPAGLANAIVDAYAALPGLDPAVAVRSSATAEDLPEASFAGQQDTYLNICGADRVLEAVKKCWASLWTARAIGYRARQGIQPEGVALAVVVQLLVNAEAAGILFTANPLNGKRDEAVINAAWGLGEAVVGGLVTPDTLTVSKSGGRLLGRETAEKLVMTVRTAAGVEQQPVPTGQRNAPVLDDEKAAELARIGWKIENFYGQPQDIEWALAEGAFAILQARPVTALPEAPIEWTLPNPKGVYMRTSITDLMPDPLSPLFESMGIPAQVAQMQPIGKRLTGQRPVLPKDYFTSINSYAYMNSTFPARAWWWILTSLIPSTLSMINKAVALWRDELHPQYQAAVAARRDISPAGMTADALWRETQGLVDAAAYYNCGLMFATMGASAGGEGLLTIAYDRWAKKQGDPDASALLMGWDNIPVRSEKSLYDIAAWARQDEELTHFILHTSTADLSAQLKLDAPISVPAFAEFRARFATHLQKFGHVVFQMDFAEPLPLDHPEMMLENIKMYLRGEGINPHERQQASQQKRVETTRSMLNRLKGIKLWGFRKALKWGQSLAEIREDALSEIGLAYPLIRELLRELGRRLVAGGALVQPEDIFWLKKDEISTCVQSINHGQPLEDLAGQVEQRKAFNRRMAQITPPPMMPMKKRVMGFKTEMFIPKHESNLQGSILKGVAASSGKVTAPARVMRGPEDFEQMQPGDVLVAATTTPAWTPLFTMAAAVVTDIGGPLSHGSIVAREYGIPAVMGTGVATRRIRSGQMITVDGAKGEVILEDSKELQAAAALPTTWELPDTKVSYARGSLAEHIPSPVSPLFATLGLRIANAATFNLWNDYIGADPSGLFGKGGFYVAINGYVYGGFHLGWKESWQMIQMSFRQLGPMLHGSVERWQAARQAFAETVAAWEKKDIRAFSPSELLEGASTLFAEAVRYYTVIQTTLPAASIAEITFSRLYNALVRRKNDPEYTALIFGFETMPVRAEKSLYDIATWIKERPALADYVTQTPTESLVAECRQSDPPADISREDWAALRARVDAHFELFGRTAYEFDFANPTPGDAPSPQFDAVKLYLQDQAVNPYERYQAAVEAREQAEEAILRRLGWPVKGWFMKSLKSAQKTGAIREDSIADMGMAHPLIRRIFAELGGRFEAGGAIDDPDDIYWLEEQEVRTLTAALEQGAPLPVYAQEIIGRKAEWRASLRIIPPIMLPEKSIFSKFFNSEAREKDGKVVLKGQGTSSGQVTAPACVLNGPEDFGKMRPGDVLVATTTTPAWTPLFAMASAIVTDIGGPLSHSSIVAREYGIPAVMAARNATRHIRSGQMVVVDGKAGTVTLL